jgi:hypothetical protein
LSTFVASARSALRAEFHALNFSGFGRHGDHLVFAGGRVPLCEPLKVRATFSRLGDFDTNTLWSVSNVPLPSTGFLLFTNYVTNLNGLRLSLVGITAPGAQIFNSGLSSTEPLAHFQIEP